MVYASAVVASPRTDSSGSVDPGPVEGGDGGATAEPAEGPGSVTPHEWLVVPCQRLRPGMGYPHPSRCCPEPTAAFRASPSPFRSRNWRAIVGAPNSASVIAAASAGRARHCRSKPVQVGILRGGRGAGIGADFLADIAAVHPVARCVTGGGAGSRHAEFDR